MISELACVSMMIDRVSGGMTPCPVPDEGEVRRYTDMGFVQRSPIFKR